MWECERWRLYKTTNIVKHQNREHFPYKRLLATEQILEEIKEGKLIGYLQCDNEVPKKLRSKVVNFSPIFKKTLVSWNHIGDLMKNYAEEQRILIRPQKMLISSFTSQNGTLITPLLWFYLQLGLVVTKNTVFFSTHQSNASTVLCSQLWTQEGEVTKIQTQV